MTPEQKQLEQIRERARDRTNSRTYTQDIDFLLSLVKSQEAGVAGATDYMSALKFVNEWIWNPPAFGGEGKAQDSGLPWHHPYKHDCAEMIVAATSHTAISMRSACVEKVKAMRGEWHDQYVKANSDTREALVIKELLYAQCQAATCIVKELETLSIEQGQK